MRRTKQESERTREQILRAARQEFFLHGVTRTTMERIAVAAGVTRGAVYWHFANKRDVFHAMREQVSLPLFDHAELPGPDCADPLDGIERFLHEVMDQMTANRQTRQTFDILSLKCEYVDEFLPELKRHVRRCSELQARLALVYRRARRMGIMRTDMEPRTAALGTCVFITGLIRLWLMDRDAKVLRTRANALIGAHVASLRRAS